MTTDSRPSSEKSILAKKKRKQKKVGSNFEWRVYAVSNAKMDTTKFTAYFTDKAIILLILTKGPKF